jgi:hypothetical protein
MKYEQHENLIEINEQYDIISEINEQHDIITENNEQHDNDLVEINEQQDILREIYEQYEILTEINEQQVNLVENDEQVNLIDSLSNEQTLKNYDTGNKVPNIRWMLMRQTYREAYVTIVGSFEEMNKLYPGRNDYIENTDLTAEEKSEAKWQLTADKDVVNIFRLREPVSV